MLTGGIPGGIIESLDLHSMAIWITCEEVIDAIRRIVTGLVIDFGTARDKSSMPLIDLLSDDGQNDLLHRCDVVSLAEAEIGLASRVIDATGTLIKDQFETHSFTPEPRGPLEVGDTAEGDLTVDVVHDRDRTRADEKRPAPQGAGHCKSR